MALWDEIGTFGQTYYDDDDDDDDDDDYYYYYYYCVELDYLFSFISNYRLFMQSKYVIFIKLFHTP